MGLVVFRSHLQEQFLFFLLCPASYYHPEFLKFKFSVIPKNSFLSNRKTACDWKTLGVAS